MLPGLIAVFVSGAVIMIAELISARLTAPFYGQSNTTWAMLSGVTLLGVTVGNFFGGILANRSKRPLLISSAALISGALALAILPLILKSLAEVCGGDNSGLFIFSLIAFLPPTLFLGGVSPSIAVAFVRAETNGRDLGSLYFASMVGSMLGSLAAGLYLPFVFPVDQICYLAALFLLVIGIFLFVYRNFRVFAPQINVGWKFRNSVPSQALLHVFVLGFVCMVSELALARIIIPVLGGSHIVWSSIFITFIGWMGVGGFFGGRFADWVSRPDGPLKCSRIPVRILYAVLLVSLYLTVILETRVFGMWTLGLSTAVRILLYIFVGFAPYAFVLGFLSAILMQQATRSAILNGDKASIGFVYAIGGIGSSCGSFFASFAFTASASLLAALPGAVRPLPAEIETDSSLQVVYRGESSYNSVAVTVNKDDQRMFTIWLDRIPHTTCNVLNPDFLASTYTRLLDASVQALVLDANKSEGARVFVIGGGGYALPRKWNEQKDKFDEISIAEIDPLVSSCAHKYMNAPADDNRVHDYIGDGRRIAKAMKREGRKNRFDCIIGDTIGDAAIPYHLATQQFFKELKEDLLADGGVYLMHVLDAYDDPGLLSSIMLTLKSVFSEVCAVSYSGVKDVRQSFVVAASMQKINSEKIVQKLTEKYKEALPIVISSSLEGLDMSRSVLLTDTFAPVEKYVWRVMTKDVQYRSYAMSSKIPELYMQDKYSEAYETAKKVLQLQPEESRALGVVYDMAVKGNNEAVGILRQQASRASVRPEAKVRYASYLMQKRMYGEALPIWEEVVRRWPDNNEYKKAYVSVSQKHKKSQVGQ